MPPGQRVIGQIDKKSVLVTVDKSESETGIPTLGEGGILRVNQQTNFTGWSPVSQNHNKCPCWAEDQHLRVRVVRTLPELI